ncbi:MAG TPA: hypothetical protein VN429_02085 [Methanospirillum sp.]|uniref:hypothetical protein n=1 Tax=Methanospirillum sp. TaxID=45200 RepID=UPI002B9234ED|nr:hypothetical protein [Methanospirillum sp.]HWQ63177.1 hypothetical protein [Methanospirillum sp.]
MLEVNEYARVLQALYNKSLILEDPSDFHPVLSFWYFDAMAHLDYSISVLAFNADSPRNLMSREYLKHRTDQGKDEPMGVFPKFMIWLEANHPEDYEKFPLFIQKIYSSTDPASYRSFRIILNPDERRPVPPETLQIMIDEMFERSYISALYKNSSVAAKLDEFTRSCR